MSLLEVLPHPIQLDKYISLAEHESRTPASFFNSPPILHLRCENCKVQIPSDLLEPEGPLQSVFGPKPVSLATNGYSSKIPVQVNFEGVHVVAASNAFLLSSPATQKTLSIPYPFITLHAIQHSPSLSSPTSKLFNLYLQITSSPSSSDDSDELIELIIIPHLPAYSKPSSADAMVVDNVDSITNYTQETLTKAMFAALTRCADLHPTHNSSAMGFFDDEDDEDVSASDDEDGDQIAIEGYGDAMDVDHAFAKIKPKKESKAIGTAGAPGDGGWITSENAHLLEKVKIEGGLGPGAGSVRPREDDDDEPEANGNDGAEVRRDGAENKWRRTG
ncbi:regulator of volume decrease after cellular swelling-domain-containing protein [Kalaharituber pfeilii]|nr:regulator of volume decrease after cellular swelling-domain-containing protein [Kalaharituber pfeilii]